jgi:hypothetical protein
MRRTVKQVNSPGFLERPAWMALMRLEVLRSQARGDICLEVILLIIPNVSIINFDRQKRSVGTGVNLEPFSLGSMGLP